MEQDREVRFHREEEEPIYQVRIGIEKKKGESRYTRWCQADSVADAYNGVAVLLRDMAEAMEQPVDRVLAVLATVLLAPSMET